MRSRNPHTCLFGIALGVALTACGRAGFAILDDAVPDDAAAPTVAVDAPSQSNRMFVTRTAVPGNFGGRIIADALCQADASAAQLQGRFIALLAVNGVLPAELAGARGFVRMDNLPIADTVDELLTGVPWFPIMHFADGTNALTVGPTDFVAWTGTRSVAQPRDCRQWTSVATSDAASFTYFGYTGMTGGFGIAGGDCANNRAHLVCTEFEHQTPLRPPVAPLDAGLAFALGASFDTVAEADALCAARARARAAPQQFLALLPLDGAAASSRFDLAGPPWQSADGQLLAPTRAAFLAMQWDTSLALLAPFGATIAIGAASFTATPTAATDCDQWRTNNGTFTARLSADGEQFSPLPLATAMLGCATRAGFICLSR